MLDINFIRENKDLVKAGAIKKHMDFDLDGLLKTDDQRRRLLKVVEEGRAKLNNLSDKVKMQSDPIAKATLIEEAKKVKEEFSKAEEGLKEIMKKWQVLMLEVPNIPDMSVPEGESDADNIEESVWGEKTVFDFDAKDHIGIMQGLDMVDFERGAKVHGFRGYYLKNDGVRLSMAIWQYALDFFETKGFTPMLVPSIVRKPTMYGTGYLPQGEEDLYKTQDEDYLTGTAEVATMGYHSGEVIDLSTDGDIKYLSFSPCFRREAGSYSKDVKGLIRVHEFYKWEQIVLCKASHEESVKYHQWLTRNTEEFIESLNIPYHRVVNCGGDLGQGQVKKYDIELWVPGEQKYREIASSSYFHDFQTRRLNIRYKDEYGKLKYAHSLNNTAIPTPRILVSLVENFQNADGSITIPDVLRKYMGGREKISK